MIDKKKKKFDICTYYEQGGGGGSESFLNLGEKKRTSDNFSLQ